MLGLGPPRVGNTLSLAFEKSVLALSIVKLTVLLAVPEMFVAERAVGEAGQ
jgi:hypothetical protein